MIESTLHDWHTKNRGDFSHISGHFKPYGILHKHLVKIQNIFQNVSWIYIGKIIYFCLFCTKSCPKHQRYELRHYTRRPVLVLHRYESGKLTHYDYASIWKIYKNKFHTKFQIYVHLLSSFYLATKLFFTHITFTIKTQFSVASPFAENQ